MEFDGEGDIASEPSPNASGGGESDWRGVLVLLLLNEHGERRTGGSSRTASWSVLKSFRLREREVIEDEENSMSLVGEGGEVFDWLDWIDCVLSVLIVSIAWLSVPDVPCCCAAPLSLLLPSCRPVLGVTSPSRVVSGGIPLSPSYCSTCTFNTGELPVGGY